MDVSVIPAKAGIHTDSMQVAKARWIPAFAGMTGRVAGMTVIECP
jgi:hypothetical protein